MHLYCEGGKKKLVHAGATGYGNNYSPAARRNFKARHHCATVSARRPASPNPSPSAYAATAGAAWHSSALGVHKIVAEGGAHNKQPEGTTEDGKVLSAARAAIKMVPYGSVATMDTSTWRPWKPSRVKQFLGRYKGVQNPRWIGARFDKETYNALWAFLRGYPTGWTPATIERFGRILEKETKLLPNGLVPFKGYKPWMKQMEEVELKMVPVSTRAAAAGHDHVAEPPAATAGLTEDAAAAGGAAAAAANKALGEAGQQLGVAGKAAAQAATEFGPQVLDAVLGVFDGLLYLVTVPLEWIYDILRLDIVSYGQKSARVARALELIASQGPDGDAAKLIMNLAKAAITSARSAAVNRRRTLNAAKELQRKLEAAKPFEPGTYTDGGERKRYKAALGRLKALAGDDFVTGDAATAEALKGPVKNFIVQLEAEMASGVYGNVPKASELQSYKKIKQNLNQIKKLLKNTDPNDIAAKITELLPTPKVESVADEGTTEPIAGVTDEGTPAPIPGGAGLVGPFATAACALAADPTGCGCGTGGNAEMSSDDDYSGSNSGDDDGD